MFTVLDGTTLQEKMLYHSPGYALGRVAFSRDGWMAISCGHNPTRHVELWDATLYQPRKTATLLPPPSWRSARGLEKASTFIYSLNFFHNTNGQAEYLLATCGDRCIRCHLESDQIAILKMPEGFDPEFAAFLDNENPERMVAGSVFELQWYTSFAEPPLRTSLPGGALWRHLWLDDCRMLFSIAAVPTRGELRPTREIQLRSAEPDAPPESYQIRIPRHTHVDHLAYSSRDQLIAIGLGENTVLLWSLRTHEIYGRIPWHSCVGGIGIMSLDFSPVESSICVAYSNKTVVHSYGS